MNIRVSEKHGVNPSMVCCPVCGKEDSIALLGKLKGDVEAPRNIPNNQPCDDCEGYMEQGIILIQVKDDDPEYRLGGFIVIKEEAASKAFPDADLSKRVLLVADSIWKHLFGKE